MQQRIFNCLTTKTFLFPNLHVFLKNFNSHKPAGHRCYIISGCKSIGALFKTIDTLSDAAFILSISRTAKINGNVHLARSFSHDVSSHRVCTLVDREFLIKAFEEDRDFVHKALEIGVSRRSAIRFVQTFGRDARITLLLSGGVNGFSYLK